MNKVAAARRDDVQRGDVRDREFPERTDRASPRLRAVATRARGASELPGHPVASTVVLALLLVALVVVVDLACRTQGKASASYRTKCVTFPTEQGVDFCLIRPPRANAVPVHFDQHPGNWHCRQLRAAPKECRS